MESKDYNILKGMMKYLGFNKDDLIKRNGALSLLMPISYPVINDEDGKINSHEEAADTLEGVGEYIMDRYYEHPYYFGEDSDARMGEGENPPLYNIIHTNNGPKMEVTIANKLTIVIQMLSAHDARALSSSLFGANKTNLKQFRENPEWTGFALLKKGKGDSVYLSRYFGNESGLGLINDITNTYDDSVQELADDTYDENDNIWKKLDGFYWNDIIK
jgi:hypothetical protein